MFWSLVWTVVWSVVWSVVWTVLISDFWISQKQIIRSCWFYCCSNNNKLLLYKDIYFCFIGYTKAFNCVHHNKLWEILKEMGLPDHLTCLLRNLHTGQEATVRTGHGTPDWLQMGKGVHQGCILSPCLVNLYAECIMRNARLNEPQAGIKTAGRNVNNLRYADDTTLLRQKVKRN